MYNINFDLSIPKLKVALLKLHESDIASLFETEVEQRLRIYNALGVIKFSEVFILLNIDTQQSFFATLNTDQKKSLLRYLETDDIKTFIESYDIKDHLQIINLLSETTQSIIHQLLAYDVGSSGSISSPHFINLDIDTSVKDATLYVTTKATEKEEVDVIFFHDETLKYVGAIALHDLILARANQKLINVFDENYPFVYEEEQIEVAIKKIRDYDINMIPVLNHEHVLKGVITADDALSMMEEIHLETIGKLVKIHDVETSDSPIKRSFVRLPWLLISGVLNIVIASFLTIFQPTLEAHIVLILFQPMILSMAGNIGTQSISVTILRFHQKHQDTKKHVIRELLIGLFNSLFSGIAGLILVYLFLWILPTDYINLNELAMTVGLSLTLAMFISATFGVLIPFVLKRFGVDEKAASGPLISTINDFTALGVYFLIATIILMMI